MRAEAARSLALIGSDLSVQPLICAMLSDQEVEVRDAAAYALGFCAEGTQTQQAVEALTSVVAAQNEMPMVRGTAAEALANLAEVQSTPVLIGTLQDASSEVRFWSAFALGQLGDTRAIPALEQLAMTDKTALANWGSVRQEALDAIKQIHEVNVGVGVC